MNKSAALAAAPLSAASSTDARTWSIEDRVALAISMAVVGLVVAAALTVQSILVFIDGSRWVAHTYQVLQTTEGAFAALNETAAAARSYVITGEDREANLRLEARKKLDATLVQLKAITADNPLQVERIDELEIMIAERRARMDAITQVRTEQGFAAARAAMIAQTNSMQGGDVRRRIEAIAATERNLLEQRRRFDDTQIRRLFIYGGVTLALVLVTLALGVWRLWRELHERRQLIVEVGQGRRFFESVVESIPFMVFVTRAQDMRIVQVNAASEEITGISRGSLIGKTAHELMNVKEPHRYDRADLAALSSREVHETQEEIMRTQRGDLRTLRMRRIVIRDTDDRPEYLLSIAEDITERFESEKQIQALNDDLAQKNHSLEVSNKELESFSYSVSHDLRSPLRAIGSFALMLEEDYGAKLDAEGLRYLGIVRGSTARMSLLIDDLLTFARFGRQDLHPAKIVTSAFVQEAIKEATQELSGPAPVIEVGALPDCFGDHSVIRQVWMNLISNAVKYSAKRPQPHIEISGEIDGRSTIFHVRDNGAGFDMRYYDKLFGVFQRLHSEGEFTGTGVGLAIVQRVVTRHGGRVWGEGEVDRGACFHFSLPNKEFE